uniref:Uncharacterized protein n=1 Tax=Cacopsylla melanoneura TaxID=428564 RepID=A0A8D8Y781_9HEMI
MAAPTRVGGQAVQMFNGSGARLSVTRVPTSAWTLHTEQLGTDHSLFQSYSRPMPHHGGPVGAHAAPQGASPGPGRCPSHRRHIRGPPVRSAGYITATGKQWGLG